ncbi:MAG TPA: hypothetical protein VNU27_01715 [Candidatus Acidoferrum sp.]|nr:hypothetical protein [Candidatus Acidoferrum sp.]
MSLETVEAIRPFGMRAAQPVVHGDQTLKLKAGRPALAVTASTDQPGPLEHLQVFGDRRLRERRISRELDNAGFASG